MAEDLPPTIPEYFSGKNVLMTGGTGFIGKVLIEKLLRSCPDVGKIYLLIRPKKNRSPEERIKTITDLPVFDLLKEKHPENLQKIVPIQGDVADLGLGISDEDRTRLIEEVNIVYHIAASVRFDDSLKDAIIMNTRGTREILNLSKEMIHLDVFLHFSTTYCHTDKDIIDEKMYPPLADWRETIEVVEKVDENALEALTQKYIEPLANTYTFSKSLGEHVVNDICDGQIPAVIIRPSIVISTMLEPFTGWIDNLNGPVALLLASGKGVLRSVYAEPEVIADYIPCDLVAKGTIIATWKKSLEKDTEKYKVNIYNGCKSDEKPITLQEILHIGKTLCWESPSNSMLWYPDFSMTRCKFYHYLKMIFYQLLPAMFLDGLLILLLYKPLLVKIQRKVFVGNAAVEYFMFHEWKFLNKKAVALEASLLPADQEAFSFQKDCEMSDPFTYFSAASLAGKKYLLKEEVSVESKFNARRMWFIAQVFNAVWYYIQIVLLYKISRMFFYYMKEICIEDLYA